MKKVILATIPHTGTHFFKKLLEDHGVHVKAIHCTKSGMGIVKKRIEDGWIVVTTHRNLDDILKSWKDRERTEGQTLYEYIYNWYRLMEHEPVIVSVDTHREVRLEFLGNVLGIDLKTDWEPVNAFRQYDIKTDTFHNEPIGETRLMQHLGLGHKQLTEDNLKMQYAAAVDSGYQGTLDEFKAKNEI